MKHNLYHCIIIFSAVCYVGLPNISTDLFRYSQDLFYMNWKSCCPVGLFLPHFYLVFLYYWTYSWRLAIISPSEQDTLNVSSQTSLLAHLTPRVTWGIAITCRPLSSVAEATINFYILINFSKTIGPMGTKPGMNDHWMVPYKEFVFFVDQKYTKETRGPKVSKMVCPYTFVQMYMYMGINYLLFICF